MTAQFRHAVNSPPASLADAARDIVSACDPGEKARLAETAATAWFARQIGRTPSARNKAMPERPGRPQAPVLLPPNKMPRRAPGGTTGRIAMLHALAHIELNAIDLTWDLIGRFCTEDLPRSFFDDFVRIGREEAAHFSLLQGRLEALGSNYGALPAHDGLWEAAHETSGSLLARMAIIPLVFEARGLDVTPAMIEKTQKAGDQSTADILGVIYRDEKFHVTAGAKWFRFLCDRQKLAPEQTFHDLVRRHFRGPLKPPFNERARTTSGLTPGFYRPLAARSR